MTSLKTLFGFRDARRRSRGRSSLRAEALEARTLLAVTVPPDITSDVIEIDDNVLVATDAATIEATAGYVQIFGNSRGRIDAVDRTATSGLTLKAASAITVTGAIGSVTPFDSLTLTASATHPVNLQQAVTLDDDLVVTRAGALTFGSTLIVGDDLTITQATNVLFAGNVTVVGDLTITSAAAVTFSGTLTVGGSLRIVDATGAVRFLGDVTAADAEVTSRDRVIAQAGFGSTGAGGTRGDISFITDQLGFNAAVISTAAATPTATLTIKPWTTSLPIMVASPPGVPTGLLITDAAISAIQGGWKRVVFGDEAAGTGAVTVGSIGSQYGFSQLLNTTTIVGGSINVVQPVDSTPQVAYLDLVARSGTITVKKPINQTEAERNDWVRLTAAGAILLEAPVWAAQTVSLTSTASSVIQDERFAAAITAPSLAVTTVGAVYLADSGNAFDTVAIMTTGGDVVLREDSGYEIGTVTTTDAVRGTPPVAVSGIVTGVKAPVAGTVRLVTVSGTEASVVSQTQKIVAASLGLEGSGADWGLASLTTDHNDVDTLAATTGSVAFRDADDLTIGTVPAAASQAALSGVDVARTFTATAGTTLTITAAGDIVSAAEYATPALVAVDLYAPDGISTAGDVTTRGADVRFNDKTILTADIVIDVVDGPDAGLVAFLSTVDGTTSGEESLTITGNLDARASLGDTTTALQSLSVSGDSTLAGGIAVRTVGDQTFSGKAASAGTMTVQAGSGATVKFLGDTVLGGLVTRTTDAADYAVAMTGAKSVITDAVTFTNTGAVTLGDGATDDVWFKAGVTSILPSSTSLAGTIRTTNASATFGQKTPVNHAVTLLADTTVSTGSGNATFSGTVDGPHRLDVNASGDTTFSSAVGGGTGTALTHLETDAPGRTLLNGGSVRTGGSTSQVYNDDVVLGIDTTLDAGTGAVTFAKTLDGGHALTVNTSGLTTFGGAVGGETPLLSLATDADGTTRINGGSITTSGSAGQVYGDAVEIGVRASTLAAGIGLVTFNGTVDSAADAAYGLTVTAAGLTTFNAAVGATKALASLQTDGDGTTAINGGSITTTGGAGQVYKDSVTIGEATVLSATGTGPVTFEKTLTGPHALTVTAAGTTTFGDTVSLESLLTDGTGTTAINGKTITTSGTAGQVYTNAVTLGSDTTLTGDTITTLGTVTGGGHDLTIAGAATLGDAAADVVTGVASLTVTGLATVNTSQVAASVIQTWKQTVTLGTDATFLGGVLSFEDPIVGGGHDLSLTGSSVVLGDAPADSVTGVDDLLITGPTELNGNTITTTGTQTFDGPVTATQATAVTLSGEGIDFTQALGRGEPDIVPPLTLTAGAGGVRFGGDVGTGGSPFGATVVRSQGEVHLAGTLWSAGPVTVASTQGAITGAVGNAIRTAGTIRLEATTGIGRQAAPIGIEAASVTAATTTGGIFLAAAGSTGNLWIGADGLVAPAGPIELSAPNVIGVAAGGRLRAGAGGVTATIPISWSIDRTSDGGPGSLRQVLLNLNEVGDANKAGLDARLVFDVPRVTTVPAPLVFTVTTSLPEIRAAVEIIGFDVVLNGNAVAGNGLAFGAAASGSLLQGITMRNFREYGLQLRSARNVTIDRIAITGLNILTSMGVYATGDLSGTRITGSRFTGGLRGMLLDGARNLRVGSTSIGQGNLFADNRAVPSQPRFAGTGIRAQGDSVGTIVEGNTFTGNNYGFGFVAARGLALKSNVFVRNSIAGIHVDGNCTGSTLGTGKDANTFATGVNRNKANIIRTRGSRGA